MTKKNDRVVIDSFAWIEYFKGSRKGQQAIPSIEGGRGITPIVVIAELSAYYVRMNSNLWEAHYRFIETKTLLAELSVEIAKAAGLCRQRMRLERPKFGLIDAIIFETAQTHKAQIVTGDPHFESLPGVIFLQDYSVGIESIT